MTAGPGLAADTWSGRASVHRGGSVEGVERSLMTGFLALGLVRRLVERQNRIDERFWFEGLQVV